MKLATYLIALVIIPCFAVGSTVGLPKSLLQNGLTLDGLLMYLMRKDCPKIYCAGVDCTLFTDSSGCQMCGCPIGSRARGCDKMPPALLEDFSTNGCPNVTDGTLTRTRALKVKRWFRHIDQQRDIDRCESYHYPLCSKLDFSLWRSPKTYSDCADLCYSETEKLELKLAQERGDNPQHHSTTALYSLH